MICLVFIKLPDPIFIEGKMVFNSIDFAIFLPTIFFLYWFGANNHPRRQNVIIILASYFFYGWWDWRFMALLLFSTFANYTISIVLSREEITIRRKALIWLSIVVNIGLLGFFKYYNFFLDNFITAFSIFGRDISTQSLHIILPIGISFYTFQSLSYTIDIYKSKLPATRDFIAFAAFVGFFPQLVAGPIERATSLLPQFLKKRTFEYDKAIDGLRQILWGLFKKVVIADNCAEYANLIFDNYSDYSGSTLVLGALFFAFQIYGDFSGYSDIAIGTARLFGLNIMKNFAFPYFSRDIAEYWRRWHISLSTWFRDYLYIPLGGSRGKTLIKIRNIFVIFIVSGFWHGANWTFIVWGILNAIYFLPLLLLNKNRQNLDIVAQGKHLPSIKELYGMVVTFSLTVLAWIFFRTANLGHAFGFLSGIFSISLLSIPQFSGRERALLITILIIFFVIIEWFGREEEYAIAKFGIKWLRPFRWAMYYSLVIAIFYSADKPQKFIYFQF